MVYTSHAARRGYYSWSIHVMYGEEGVIHGLCPSLKMDGEYGLIIEREAFEADLYTIFQHRLKLQHYKPIPFHRTSGIHSTIFACAIAASSTCLLRAPPTSLSA